VLADLDPSTMGQTEKDKKQLTPGAGAQAGMGAAAPTEPSQTDEMAMPGSSGGAGAMLGSGGGGGMMAGGQGGQGSTESESGPVQKASSSGRFQNLNRFLDANKGAQFASQVGQNIATQGTQARQATEQAKAQTAEAVRGQIEQKQQTLGQARGALEQLRGGQPQQEQAQQTPFDTGQAESALRAGLDINYQGPQDVDNAAQLRQQATQVSERAGMTGTEQGRFQLLRDMFGQPSYSQGQQRLDQMILGQGGQGELAKARESVRDLPGFTTQAIDEARAGIQDARGAFGTAREELLGDIRESETGLTGDLEALRENRQREIDEFVGGNKYSLDLLQQAVQNDPELAGRIKGIVQNPGESSPMMQVQTDAGIVNIPMDRLLGSGLAGLQGVEATMGNVDLEAAERLNVLRRLSGQNPEISLAEQALQNPELALNSREIGGQLDSIISQANQMAKGSPFGQSTELATHLATHKNEALRDLVANPSQSALFNFLTPSEQARAKQLETAKASASGKNRSATIRKIEDELRILGYQARRNVDQQLAFNEKFQSDFAALQRGAFGGPGSGLVTTFDNSTTTQAQHVEDGGWDGIFRSPRPV
jgi:hypothetical protein